MARSFNGTSDKISLGTTHGVGSANPWSCSGWVFPTAVQDGCIVAKRTTFSSNNQFDFSVSAQTTLRLDITKGSSFFITNEFLTQNAWNHCACACGNDGATVIYLNGVACTSFNNNATLAANWTSGSGVTGAIEAIGTTEAAFFKGRLADIVYWNVKLTVAELLMLASGLRAKYIRPGSIVGYWPLAGRANYEPDLSPNAINGTLTGTTPVPDPPLLPDMNRILMTIPAEGEMPILSPGPSFISGWSRQSNLPVIGGGTF